MRTSSYILAIASVAFLCAQVALCQIPPTPGDLQVKFEREPDVMRRARLMMELSRADFKEISEKVAAGDNTDALNILQQFMDDAQKCSDELDGKEANPEAHSGGFKQLQIATRESLRRLDDITVTMVADEQTPFLAIRNNLDQLNRHLIRELFPHEPQSSAPAGGKDSGNAGAPSPQGAPR
jgi:hypothetical protein